MPGRSALRAPITIARRVKALRDLASGVIASIGGLRAKALAQGPTLHFFVNALGHFQMMAAVSIGLATIYRFGPKPPSRALAMVSVGTLVATASWMASSAFLSWYLSSYAHYDVTYGSLGTGIGLMMWMWLSAIVVLLGAELNSEIEHQTARDSTVSGDRPLGGRCYGR